MKLDYYSSTINYSHTLCVIESAFMHTQGAGNFIIALLGIVTAVIHWNSLKIVKTLVRQIVCPAMYNCHCVHRLSQYHKPLYTQVGVVGSHRVGSVKTEHDQLKLLSASCITKNSQIHAKLTRIVPHHIYHGHAVPTLKSCANCKIA